MRMSKSKLTMREKRMVFFSFLLLFKSRLLNFFAFRIVLNFFLVLLVFAIFVLVHNFIYLSSLILFFKIKGCRLSLVGMQV